MLDSVILATTNYHYEGLRFTPPIILNGKVYYNVPSLPIMGWYCLDLYTGEKVYFQNTTGPVTGSGGGFDASGSIQGGKLAFGQIFDYESPKPARRHSLLMEHN